MTRILSSSIQPEEKLQMHFTKKKTGMKLNIMTTPLIRVYRAPPPHRIGWHLVTFKHLG
jgi:hypothetical protein